MPSDIGLTEIKQFERRPVLLEQSAVPGLRASFDSLSTLSFDKLRMSGDILMRIAMIGTRYVGLVSGTCFTDFGHNVTCLDKDEARSASLRPARTLIREPGLDQPVAVRRAGLEVHGVGRGEADG